MTLSFNSKFVSPTLQHCNTHELTCDLARQALVLQPSPPRGGSLDSDQRTHGPYRQSPLPSRYPIQESRHHMIRRLTKTLQTKSTSSTGHTGSNYTPRARSLSPLMGAIVTTRGRVLYVDVSRALES